MAITAIAPVAAADPVIDDATRLQTALDYEGALAVLDRALAAGGATADDYAARQLLAGALAAGLDHVDAARDHYARALAVRPDIRLHQATETAAAAIEADPHPAAPPPTEVSIAPVVTPVTPPASSTSSTPEEPQPVQLEDTVIEIHDDE